jgi:hypothetical protein
MLAIDIPKIVKDIAGKLSWRVLLLTLNALQMMAAPTVDP